MRFRQIHLDFHTAAQIPGIGSAFDPEDFAAAFANAHVDSVNLFSKCHHGLSYHPTEVGLHWNPSSVVGHEISWSREGAKPEIFNKMRGSDVPPRVLIPAPLYDSLYKYSARDFDAAALVAKARTWGFKYIYLTTKHHDGFSNFDTDQNSYKVSARDCPAGRDVTRELADACHAAEMGFGVCYSQPDWHHPDYRTEHHARYIAYFTHRSKSCAPALAT